MTTNFQDMKATARRSYRYLPVFLLRRLRELESHLDAATTAQLEQAAPLPRNVSNPLAERCRAVGLPLPANPPPPAVEPPVQMPDVERLTFEVMSAEGGTVRLLAVAQHRGKAAQIYDLARAADGHRGYLEDAANNLNQLLTDVDRTETFQVALYWAGLHGAPKGEWESKTTMRRAYRPAAGEGRLIPFRPATGTNTHVSREGSPFDAF